MFKCELFAKKFKSKQGLSCHTTVRHKKEEWPIPEKVSPEKRKNEILVFVIMQLLEGYKL